MRRLKDSLLVPSCPGKTVGSVHGKKGLERMRREPSAISLSVLMPLYHTNMCDSGFGHPGLCFGVRMKNPLLLMAMLWKRLISLCFTGKYQL